MILKPKYIPKPRFMAETLTLYTQPDIDSGAISLRSVQHADKFIRDCKEAGVLNSLWFFMLFIGNNLSLAMRSWNSSVGGPAAAAVNMVESDYSEATGIAGNGTTKYVDSGYPATELAATAHVSVYLREDPLTTQYLMGVNGPAAADIAGISTTAGTFTAGFLGKTNGAAESAVPVKGFLYADRSGPTNIALYRNNTQIATSVVNVVPAYPARNFYICARNNDGALASLGNRKISFVSAGASMTAQQRTDFYSIVQTLQTNLGRNI